MLVPVTFVAGGEGAWRIEGLRSIVGASLPSAARLAVDAQVQGIGDVWRLRGVVSHQRYTTRAERTELDAASPPLGRPQATCAALIPIRKSAAWWELAQDERRALFADRTQHIRDCMPWLPRIARRLYHARELGESFDFLTWFEFAPDDSAAFDDLLAMLRARDEWRFVDREVELRLQR